MKNFIKSLLGIRNYSYSEYMDTLIFLEEQKGKIGLRSGLKLRMDVWDYEDNAGLCINDNIDNSRKLNDPDYFSRIVVNVQEKGSIVGTDPLISLKMGRNKCNITFTHYQKNKQTFLLNEKFTFRDLDVALVFFKTKADTLARVFKE